MANGTNGMHRQNAAPARNGSGAPPKKADVIIQITRDISRKQEDVRNQTQLINSRLESVAEISNQSRDNAQEAINKSDVVYNLVADSITALKQEITYLAAQNENIYLNLNEKLAGLNKALDELKKCQGVVSEKRETAGEASNEQVDYDAIADKLAERLPQPVYEGNGTAIDYDLLSDKIAGKIPAPVVTASAGETPVVAQPVQIDYEALADKVAAHIPVQEAISTDYIASKVAEQIVIPSSEVDIDYDGLAKKVAQQIGVAPAATPVVVNSSGEVAIDYEYLSDKVASKVLSSQGETAVPAEIDYETLADKVADRIHIETSAESLAVEIDYELLADKVAERIHIENNAEPQAVEIDYELLADKVADRIISERPETSGAEIDLDALADKVAERIPAYQQVHTMAAALPSSATVNINEDSLADKIVRKMGVNNKSDDFDIIVDEDGCDSISKAIAEKLDYDAIAASVSERLNIALDLSNSDEPDYDEMANRIGEKIQIPAISEDAIADKAAAVLSNYLPDIDTDEIADKIANQILSALPVNDDTLADRVADKVVSSLPRKEEGEEEEALQIELDYEELADKVADKVVNSLPESKVSNGGVVVASTAKAQISEEDLNKVCDKITKTSGERFDGIDKDLDEIKALLEKGVQLAELAPAAERTITEDNDVLVTVSDIVSETEESSDEQTYEEDVSDPKTLPSEDDESLGIGDEFSEASGGVDFLNMMKYNRSFIARIIQGTDDQKEYYGRIKNALLSYKKVNSNIAWGAERFHKGRETIARLKIRGKTLILYLALDPAEVPYSVYHHKDVSDNKSLHGTPLSVKVMSPLGVKKAIRLIDAMLEKRDGIKRPIPERDYTEMYPYETIEELIADGLVQDVRKP